MAASYVLLGYCFSLAASQSLFFAYQLLTSRQKRKNWVPHQALILIPTLAALLPLPALQWTQSQHPDAKKTFNFLQAVVAFLPLVLALLVQVCLR
jgi:hypothetical protein